MAPERDMSQLSDEFLLPGHAYPAYPAGTRGGRAARPPLTKRMRCGHWIAIDCVVGGFAALSGVAIHGAAAGRFQPLAWLVLAAGIFFPMALRRRAPATALGALLVLGVLVSGMAPAVPAMIFLTAAYVLYTVTVGSSRRTGAAALGLVLAVMLAVAGANRAHPRVAAAGEFVPVALANVIAWMTGYSMRQRRLYVVTLQHQAASSAVAQERLRIARELHDVVAHSMSVIAVQAGYGQYVIDVSPEGAKDALGAIQATSRDALEEMRRMLGVLRQQDAAASHAAQPSASGVSLGAGHADAASLSAAAVSAVQADGGVPGPGRPEPAPLAPAPGLASLDRLVQRTCGAGVQVSVKISGAARAAPAGVDLSAYRIIQEALTNVVKHAGTGAHCTVSLVYTPDVLDIRVTDDGGRPLVPSPASPVFASPVFASTGPAGTGPAGSLTPGTGHGIIGMRERANLCGGSFSAAPLAEGGFRVTATLPLPPPGMAGTPGTAGRDGQG